jgi:hypothetical protein
MQSGKIESSRRSQGRTRLFADMCTAPGCPNNIPKRQITPNPRFPLSANQIRENVSRNQREAGDHPRSLVEKSLECDQSNEVGGFSLLTFIEIVVAILWLYTVSETCFNCSHIESWSTPLKFQSFHQL